MQLMYCTIESSTHLSFSLWHVFGSVVNKFLRQIAAVFGYQITSSYVYVCLIKRVAYAIYFQNKYCSYNEHRVFDR